MKQIYSWIIVALAFIPAFHPADCAAQCTCTGGVAATPYSQSVTIAPTKASTINFVFQQFNPALYPPTYNTLACVSLRDTISGVSTTNVTNTADSSIAYKFLLSLNNDVSGPGIDINDQTFNKIYGPDTLQPFGMPKDTITYGPDNIFSNSTSSGSTGANANYIGTGNVGFTYSINGGLITLKGGANYIQQITTVIGGTFTLTYYVCPTIALASNGINNFTAFRKDKKVLLQWTAPNDQKNYDYEIEHSRDGKDFGPVGHMPSSTASTGNVTEYQYQYNLDPSDVGQIYFRIKRSDAEGDVLYSIVKLVNLDANGSVDIQTYPNPVVSSVTVLFQERQTGNFFMELFNLSGQILERKEINLSGTNSATLNLTSHPARGLYFLRAVDKGSNKQYLTKILIK
jgi:hypothetical protein